LLPNNSSMTVSNRVSVWKAALEAGLIIGGVQIIVGLILFLIDMQSGTVATVTSIVTLAGVLSFVQIRFRERSNGGFIS
jgi:hypothetical protein